MLPTKVLTTIPVAGALLFYQGRCFKYGSKVGRRQTGGKNHSKTGHVLLGLCQEVLNKELGNLSKFAKISIYAGTSLGVNMFDDSICPLPGYADLWADLLHVRLP